MNRQLFSYHPDFGYLFIPGLKTRVEHESGGYLLQTNSLGFRSSREFVCQKQPGSFRILLFGDSYSAGDGVSNRDRFGDVLETLLPEVEVYNFAVPGTGTDQQYLIWREYAPQFEHDLVLLGVLVENIRRVASRYRVYDVGGGKTQVFAKPYFTLAPDNSLKLHHQPVPKYPVDQTQLSAEERALVDRGGDWQILRKVVGALGSAVKDKIQELTRYQPVTGYNSPDNPDWLLMRAILKVWIAESAQPLLMMPIPLYQHVEETASADDYQQRFKELGHESAAVIHDPLADYQALAIEKRRAFRFTKDVHPTPAAHQLLARSLAPIVEALRANQSRTAACHQ